MCVGIYIRKLRKNYFVSKILPSAGATPHFKDRLQASTHKHDVTSTFESAHKNRNQMTINLLNRYFRTNPSNRFFLTYGLGDKSYCYPF